MGMYGVWTSEPAHITNGRQHNQSGVACAPSAVTLVLLPISCSINRRDLVMTVLVPISSQDNLPVGSIQDLAC